jgi:membrane protein implicated in regulation of membrane protease activity
MIGMVKVQNIFAITVGGLVASMAPVMFWLQFVAAFCSAVMGLYGVYKVFRKK